MTGSGALSPARAALADLSAAIAAGDAEALRSALEAAAAAAGPAEVEEALLQAYLFLGFPAVLEAMALWRERRGAPPVRERDPLATPDSLEGWRARGESYCRSVYGSAYEKLRENVRRMHPALDRWMVEEGYGKVLSRPGLDPVTRELCIVALLVVSDRPPQLHSHLRGALGVGAEPAEVGAALALALARQADPGARRRAERLWDRVRERSRRPG